MRKDINSRSYKKFHIIKFDIDNFKYKQFYGFEFG